MEVHTDIGIRPQDPCDDLPLQRRKFGPIQPYGLIGAQAKPLSQNDQGGEAYPFTKSSWKTTSLQPLRKAKTLL
jgi:hypothetical protein